MKKIAFKVSKFLALISLMSFTAEAQVNRKGLWVYFDLGDTVVLSKDMKKIKYFPGSKAYLSKLHQVGYKVGLISNIPESWGLDYNEKLLSLKKVISDGWIDAEKFDWDIFDEILLPLKNNEMKPAPFLFLRAIEKAGGCPSLYIGESPNEIQAAESHGMAGKLFAPNQPDLYIPMNDLRNYIIQNYKISYDEECLQ